jgi:hypothetical protein
VPACWVTLLSLDSARTRSMLTCSSSASCGRVVTRVAASEQVENTRFAAWLEPNNASVVSRNLWAVKRRAHREPTVGRVTLGEERQLNPFLRVRDPEFALMTLRRSAKLNLEKGKWYLKWRSLLARRSKADLYLHDDDEPSRCVHAACSCADRHRTSVTAP